MKKKPSVAAFRTPPKPPSQKPTPHTTPSKDGLPNSNNSISNGLHETPNLLSESPAMLGLKSKLNGVPPPPLPSDVGFWEGETGSDTTPDIDMDMDMDMFTEEGDGDVDEEVRSLPPSNPNLI